MIRTFISVPAGVARMNFAKFTLYTILGCLPWTFALAWMGYVLGDNWTAAEKVIRPVAWVIALAHLGGRHLVGRPGGGARSARSTRRWTGSAPNRLRKKG